MIKKAIYEAIAFGATLFIAITLFVVATQNVDSLWASIGLGLLPVIILYYGASKKYPSLKIPTLIGAAVYILPFVAITASQLDDNPTPKLAPEGKTIEYWELSTGSRLGYIKYKPENSNGRPPVLFLHGGPGASIIGGLSFADLLSQNGFTVYGFDQAGSGYSDNIPLDEYSLNRSVEDLEAIREALGVPQVILIGHSFGSILAADYMTKHDDKVEASVFLAPGPYTETGLDWDIPNLTDQSNGDAGAPVFTGDFPLPAIGMMMLNEYNATNGVLEDIISQNQIKSFIENNLDRKESMRGWYCKGKSPAEVPVAMQYPMVNLYVNILINESSKDAEDLKKIKTPTLILRGNCDYVPVKASTDFRDLIPNATFIELEGFGHSLMSEGTPLENTLNFLNSIPNNER